MNIIDLHMHSTFSDDGQYCVEELINKCVEANLQVISITDHNSVEAHLQIQKMRRFFNLKIIPGIELDCTYKGINLHLLGYNIDVTQAVFKENYDTIMKQEYEASKIRLAKVRELGIIINDETLNKLAPHKVYTGETLAEIALNDPSNDHNPLLLPYRENGKRSDNPFVNFYWDYCSQDKIAYAPVNFISLNEAIDIIHNAGGKCVVAHPGNNFKNHPDELKEILALNTDGLEVYSSYHNAEQTNYYHALALEFNKLITVGSDFHGKTKPSIKVGSVNTIEDQNILISKLDH